jgi:hypothetical protein
VARAGVIDLPGMRRVLPLAALIAVVLAAAAAAAVTPAALIRSRASAHVVQPQPAPDSCHARGHGDLSLPDPRCTPGAIDPTVTPRDLSTTICRSGYSESVRPPESVTEPEKRGSLRSYGDHGALHSFEYDHLISLELGGARNDVRNLWPEPGASPNVKDTLENRLHARVCAGAMTLASAQLAIARDWVNAYHRYGG